MKLQITDLEARVIGCLIEKEITTPEQYPLSLNALVNACNQKSNREPVMTLDEATVQNTLDSLVKQYLASDKGGFGSRVTKYKHRFCNTEFGSLQFSEQELGIVCVLLLRGPQTPGELRTRTNRLCKFTDVGEVEAALDALMAREDGPFVAKLPREPGKRESRYAHLFSGDAPAVEAVQSVDAPSSPQPKSGVIERLEDLEAKVDELRQAVDDVRAQLKGISR
jgi:uncharacterized protein YceH (UPF0502 family)